MTRRADVLRTLAKREEGQAREAILAGDTEAAERALQRAQTLRRIAYMRSAAATYQRNPSLNPVAHATDDTIEIVRSATPAPELDPPPGRHGSR